MLYLQVWESSKEMRAQHRAFRGSFNVDSLQRSPKEQVDLMVDYAKRWADGGATVMTTSDHIVNGVRLAIKRGIVKPDEVRVIWFHQDCEVGEDIDIDENGSLSRYPLGFLDTWNDVLMELMRPNK